MDFEEPVPPDNLDALKELKQKALEEHIPILMDDTLEKIEEIGNEVKGVDKAYAIQAGRELRVVVKPEEVDDLMSYQIARNIKEKIDGDQALKNDRDFYN